MLGLANGLRGTPLVRLPAVGWLERGRTSTTLETVTPAFSWLAINQFFDRAATSDQLGRKIQTAKNRVSGKKRAREEQNDADGRVSPSLRLSS